MIPEYLEALENEIGQYRLAASECMVQSVYFGGGTPSLIHSEGIKKVLESVRGNFPVQSNSEITLEANPGTVDLGYLKRLRNAGINRLSLGIQSLNDAELQLLGRIHTAGEGVTIFNLARKAGFANVSVDLMYGLPDQTVESFMRSLTGVIDLQPEHISMYPLTLSDRVPLARMIDKGHIAQLDDDRTAEMYEKASEVLNAYEYQQYEISNWAMRSSTHDFRSKHNLQYWHNLPYLGIGAGAHGFFKNYRLENVHRIGSYIGKLSSKGQITFPGMPAVKKIDRIGLWEEIQETMMLGLRLTEEGIGSAAFNQRYHFSLEEIFARQIYKLEFEGLIERMNDHNPGIRLTKKGRLLGNLVFREFVGNEEPKNIIDRLSTR